MDVVFLVHYYPAPQCLCRATAMKLEEELSISWNLKKLTLWMGNFTRSDNSKTAGKPDMKVAPVMFFVFNKQNYSFRYNQY